MQFFDVDTLAIGAESVVLQLGSRPAICKPSGLTQMRHMPPAKPDSQ